VLGMERMPSGKTPGSEFREEENIILFLLTIDFRGQSIKH
jgi:hypothetical protein